MIEKPDLPEDQIATGLRESYGVAASELEFLPIGNDRLAWVYRVVAGDGATYFLKLRKGAIDEISLLVPRALKAAGVARVVAPLPTVTGDAPWGTVGDYALILYPFVEGRDAKRLGLTDPQWTEYGAILRQIHAARLPDPVLRRVPRESFVSAWIRGARELLTAVESGDNGDPYARELAAFWNEHREEIERILERGEELGRALRARPLEFVLCHTDIHTANILVDPDGRLCVVDWDAPLLAPKERDLHFVVGSVVGRAIGPREEELILRGYGPTAIDWPALIYYRYEWVCGDLLEYGQSVLATTDSGATTKKDALRRLREMFRPGGAVASAFGLERRGITRRDG